jgi:uncharacterized membrane protein YvlD (DUF360 family)
MVVPRMLATLVVAAAVMLVLGAILPGFDVSSPGAAIGFAAVAGLLNALLWPLLPRVALPLTVVTLGLGALVLNGLVTLLAAVVAPGVELDGLGSAVVLCVVLAAVVTGWSAHAMPARRPASSSWRSTGSPSASCDGRCAARLARTPWA